MIVSLTSDLGTRARTRLALATFLVSTAFVTGASAQTIIDGPIRVQMRVREINTLGAPTDAAMFGVVGVPDDQTYFVRARDASNLDGVDWTSGTGCRTQAFDPPMLSADLNSLIFDQVYASVTPDALEIQLDAWEDEQPDQLLGIGCGGSRCAYDTGFCCGGFLFGLCLGAIDDDDARCLASPFAAIDYRAGDPCVVFDHGEITSSAAGSCANYRPRIETFWRYLAGDTLAEPIELGDLAEMGAITHVNNTSSVCYSDGDGAVATPDVFVAVDLPAARQVAVQACASGSVVGLAVLDASGVELATTTNGCLTPLTVPRCGGRVVIRIDAASAAGEVFTLTVVDAPATYPNATCCGDGIVDRGEACEDGNPDDTDACLSTCTAASCGDGFVRVGTETCDDGADNGDPNACNLACTGATPPVCGNDILESGEGCDDGSLNGTPNHCANGCASATPSVCGNTTVEAGENCDTGAASASCDADCTDPVCGDGETNGPAGETCDDGSANGTAGLCNASCAGTTPSTCGNGTTETGEDCDDAGESAACNRDCTSAACGDSVVNAAASEACDDGSQNGRPNGCAIDCQGTTASSCGNAVVEIGESCDAGGQNAACDADCTAVVCGDQIANAAAGETCDAGASNGTAGVCNASCSGVTPSTCGNGLVEAGEACDGAGETEVCNRDCSVATCGDGVLNRAASETCDDGLQNGEPNHCNADCTGGSAVTCGNSVVEIGENCDTGGASPTCDADCTSSVCGDGVLNVEASERCDEGPDNGSPGGSCSARCEPQAPLRLDGGACSTTPGAKGSVTWLGVFGVCLLIARRVRARAGRRA